MSGEFSISFDAGFFHQGGETFPLVLVINGYDAPAVVALALIGTIGGGDQTAVAFGSGLAFVHVILEIFRTEQRSADFLLSAVDPLTTTGFLALNQRQHHAEGAGDAAHKVWMLGAR